MADYPHADATPVELISQNEALQRERSGGFLANGQYAPRVAAVDMQSPPPGGGTAPKQPATQPQPARGPASPTVSPEDDDYYSEKAAAPAPGKKAVKGKQQKSVEEDDYYGAHEVEAPAPPIKKQPGVLDYLRETLLDPALTGFQKARQTAAVLENKVGRSPESAGGAIASAQKAIPAKPEFEKLADEQMSQAKTAFGVLDAYIGNPRAALAYTIEGLVQSGASLGMAMGAGAAGGAVGGAVVSGPAAPVGAAIGAGVGTVAGAATGGYLDAYGQTVIATLHDHGVDMADQAAVTAALKDPALMSQANDAARKAGVPAAIINAASFGIAGKVFKPVAGAVTKKLGSAIAGKVAGVAGEAAAQGAVGGVGEAATQEYNSGGITNPNAIAADALSQVAVGGAFAALHARGQGMPHQAVEQPQNIMEHAQQVAAAEEAARGGDSLSQVGAAAYVNAHLSAHHDAAAYEAHMETQHQRVTEENAIADQQAEQQAREDALNMAANEKAPATTPTEGFEEQAKTLQERKDADFAKARNQVGDQEVARGETLEAGVEKGGAEEPKSTLADADTEGVFKTLKERRASEDTKSDTKSVSDRLKEQNPEDNFLPFTESPKSAKEDIAEKPAEGDTWKAPTGATVEVLKDHNDGTYTVRTTPADSSQSPRRRRVSEAALDLMRSTAEPPENLQERRAAEASEVPAEKPAAEPAVTAEAVDTAAHEAATSPKNEEPMPTEAQQNAGNFKMGHTEVQGMPITIEHPEGSARPSGATMEGGHYGYFKGTIDADGQHTDVMVGKEPTAETAYVVDHLGPDGGFEQHKVLLGFGNRLAAMRAYRSAFPDRALGPVSEVHTDRLKDWLKNGDTTKPYDQKGVNRLQDTRFADTPRADVPVEHRAEGNEHSVKSPNGMTMADRQPSGNLRVVSTETSPRMRGHGEATARHERLAQEAHKTGDKLESGTEVSEPAQRVYKSLADRGYDVKENPSTTDAQGRKTSTSELKPVYEVGPKEPATRAREQFEAPHGRDASDADRRVRPRITQEEAESALKPLTDKIGTEGIQVHADSTTLPDNIKAEMAQYNHPNPRGVYDTNTDTVHIVAGAHRSADELMRTAVHETVGHQGIRRLFDSVPEFKKAMQDIYDNIHDRAGAIGSPLKGVNKTSAKQWMKDYMTQHGLDARNPRHQQLAVDEYIAHLAEHDINDPAQQNPSLLRRAIDAVRSGLRKLGAVREWTDADIRALIRKSANNLAAENAGIRESAKLKGDGARFADEEDHGVEGLAPDHPLAQAHKYGLTKEAQANYNPGYVKSRQDAVENANANSKDSVLGMISLHNLPDFIDQKIMPAPRAFSRMVQRMDGRRGQLAEKATKPLRDWETWARKNKATDAKLREIMGASTLGGTDPSKPFESRYTDAAKAADPTKQAHESMQRDLHKQLKAAYDSLDDKGRELYNTVRDHYGEMRDTAQAAFQQRIKESGGSGEAKTRLLDTLRAEFESGRVQGPYFPLARFGDRWAAAKHADGSVFSFSRFESKAEQRAWLAQRKAEGFTDEQLSGGQKADTSSTISKIDPNFVAKITDMVKGLDPGLADEIWQEYLKQMPEMSMRKNFIHRQGRLGFSGDQLRAFAYNSFHSAHQIARLEYAHKLDGIMDDMDAQREAIDKKGPTSSDSDWANAMTREFGKRYDWIKNPRGHPLAAALTKFGASWYLGWSPATAFRVLSQNPMIALPTLGGEHGYLGATKELGRAMGQWAKSKGDLGDSLRGDERKAFDEASNMGVFTNNFTQTLASGGAGNPMYTGATYHYMRASQFIFNGMEHLNRQSTYLAAYRLARTQGMDHEAAVYHAVDMSRLSHFDYSNANRPRILQSNSAKVIGLFKSYSAGVTYRLAREFREATTLEHQDPGERAKAFKTFAGLMGGTMMFAGVTGVPFSWLAFYAMNKVFGDKDQPFDSKAALHQWLSDHMGHTAADAIVTGPVGAMSHANLSTGASYSDLWYKPPARDMKPGEQWSDLLGQAAGAVVAVPANMATGVQLAGDDHIERGLEHFVPPAVAGPMKAWRYAQEGVTNLQGEQIISKDELSGWEIALQALDFTPQKVRDAQEWSTARKNLDKEIGDRKTLLLNRFDTAVNNGDSDAITKASEDLTRFAQVNPGLAKDLAKTEVSSVMSKAKKSATSVAGANLNPGLRNLDSIYGSSPFPPEEK
jgi:hypothetical protein